MSPEPSQEFSSSSVADALVEEGIEEFDKFEGGWEGPGMGMAVPEEAAGAPLGEVALEGDSAARTDALGRADSEDEEVWLTISAEELDADAGKAVDEFTKMWFCAPSR